MKVFISHAETDAAAALRLAAALREVGLDPFVAEDEMYPGDNWAEVIGRGLAEAEAMIVLLSPESLRSPWVRNEIVHALGELRFKDRVLPMVVGPREEIPSDLVPWPLHNFQWYDAREGDEPDIARRVAAALTHAAA